VARHFAACGLEVTGTYRAESPATERLRAECPGIDLRRLDLADRDGFARLPPRVDAIAHIAGVSAAPGTAVDAMLACNVTGARNVLRYAHDASAARLVYASTLSVHGRIEAAVVDETTPIRDPDVYGASKHLAERMFAGHAEQFAGASVRLPGVLGPGAHRAWLPTLLQSMGEHRDTTIYNAHNRFNNAAHVDDLGALFLAVLTSDEPGFPAFPVGASSELTVQEIVTRVQALTGSRSRITALELERPAFTISSRFAIERFGYRPRSIEAMIEDYCAAPA
jgi:nucleoside-diphosphate-sugar epimerase